MFYYCLCHPMLHCEVKTDHTNILGADCTYLWWQNGIYVPPYSLSPLPFPRQPAVVVPYCHHKKVYSSRWPDFRGPKSTVLAFLWWQRGWNNKTNYWRKINKWYKTKTHWNLQVLPCIIQLHACFVFDWHYFLHWKRHYFLSL